MLRRWVPAGLLLSSVTMMSAASMAQAAPSKPAAPATTAKPAATSTSAKPAAPTAAKPAAPTADAKAGTTAAAAAPTPDAKAPAPTGAASPDPDKEAARLIEEGRKANKAGQFDKARELFAAAYKLKPESNTLLLLGLSEAKSNRPRDAAEHLEVFLREAKTAPAEDRETATRVFNDVTAKLGTWWLKIPIEGAEVFLNGRLVGRSPLAAPLFVEPGTHDIEVKKEGYEPAKEIHVVAPNTESETDVVLKPLPASVGPKKPPPGPEKPKPPPPPPPLPEWHTYGLIGGGALTALGLGLGIGLTVSAGGKGEEADKQLAEIARTTPNTYGLCGPNSFQPNQPACAQLKDTLSSQDARANGAVAGFVIAGVGAVGTVGLFLLPKVPIGRSIIGMKFAPVIGFDRLGGTLTGSF